MKFCETCKHNDRSEQAVATIGAALSATRRALLGIPADDKGGLCRERDYSCVVYLRSPSCDAYEEKPA